jgi:serine/threonine protein kinase
MLYEALTGNLPFDGESTLEIWEGHVCRLPRSPAELSPETVTTDLESIIMTLLAKAPDERFSSAAAVAAALASQLEGSSRMSVDLPRGPSPGASASDVARAFPSKLNSQHMIPLGGLEQAAGLAAAPPPLPREPAKRSAEVAVLRDVLDAGLEIEEPAADTENPAQVSALDINLGVRDQETLPQWAQRGGSSTRMTRVPASARRPSKSGGGLVAALLVGLIVVAAATVMFLR